MEIPTKQKKTVYIAAIAMCIIAPLLVVVFMRSPEASSAASVAPSQTTPAVVRPAPATTELSPVTESVAESSEAPKADAHATALNAMMAEAVAQAVMAHTYELSSIIGGGGFSPTPFEDVSPNGILIGLRLGVGKFNDMDVFKYVQPIYLTHTGELCGKGYGRSTYRVAELEAPAGYAIGTIRACSGMGFDSISIDYMRIENGRLNPQQIKRTPTIGTKHGNETTFGGDGTPMIGICGREDDRGDFLGFGVVYLQAKPKPAPKAVLKFKPARR